MGYRRELRAESTDPRWDETLGDAALMRLMPKRARYPGGVMTRRAPL
jgi:hypothetical protein